MASVVKEGDLEPVCVAPLSVSMGIGELGLGSGKRGRVSDDDGCLPSKRPKTEVKLEQVVEPFPPALPAPVPFCRQFWKAGDFELQETTTDPLPSSSGGPNYARINPKFLHSNATSHKWALGAVAELLDNSMDEVFHGATFVNIDLLLNQKDGSKMLLVEDDGGGMDPERLRQCMSLGYSDKTKSSGAIGQYGNGFKTSTMRLGADVIVFSRNAGKDGRSPTQSIGMLSYTFLTMTRKQDTIVPVIDYKKEGEGWNKLIGSSSDDWDNNLETIVQWSPYLSELDLFQQFSSMIDHGTRVVIYNLWEDDQGELELDFDADNHDIQVRGFNRDDKKIQMAEQFPNSMHFLTYRHSLRSYASILYLRLPPHFRMILRGKEIEHHNIVNDMMLKEEITYRPNQGADGVPRNQNMLALVTIGFIKDAKDHIDVQGFNVYHKNRLIKPFLRLWNPAGSDGRGVIGVLEANFVEPAHDKQGFERTNVLSRLEARLREMQKTYWNSNCHKIGYAPRNRKKHTNESGDKGISHETFLPPSQHIKKNPHLNKMSPDVSKPQDLTMNQSSESSLNLGYKVTAVGPATLRYLNSPDVHFSSTTGYEEKFADKFDNGGLQSKSSGLKSPLARNPSQEESAYPYLLSLPWYTDNGSVRAYTYHKATTSQSKVSHATCDGSGVHIGNSECSFQLLEDENRSLKDRMKNMEISTSRELQCERNKSKELADRIKAMAEEHEALKQKLVKAEKRQQTLIEIYSEDRCRRDKEEDNLRKDAEDSRKEAENSRKEAENSRKEAENLRKKLLEAAAIIQKFMMGKLSSNHNIKQEH